MSGGGNLHALLDSTRQKRRPSSSLITPLNDLNPTSRRRINYDIGDMTTQLATSGVLSPSANGEMMMEEGLNDSTTANNEEDQEVFPEDQEVFAEDEWFILSPFGLRCLDPTCIRPQILGKDRNIRDHLKSHKIDFTNDQVANVLKRVEEVARTLER